MYSFRGGDRKPVEGLKNCFDMVITHSHQDPSCKALHVLEVLKDLARNTNKKPITVV